MTAPAAPTFAPDDARVLKIAKLLRGDAPVLIDARLTTPGELLGDFNAHAIPGDVVVTIEDRNTRLRTAWLIDMRGGALKLSASRAPVVLV